ARPSRPRDPALHSSCLAGVSRSGAATGLPSLGEAVAASAAWCAAPTARRRGRVGVSRITGIIFGAGSL
ncbi:unnamed protein product, partial [Polarella glacialis]